jgi:hypothetical protein
MKVTLKPEEKIMIKPNANKQLNITIFFKDRFSLMKIMYSIVRSVHLGTQFKRDNHDENYFEYEMKYLKKMNYKERHINGNVCHVYKSKI